MKENIDEEIENPVYINNESFGINLKKLSSKIKHKLKKLGIDIQFDIYG